MYARLCMDYDHNCIMTITLRPHYNQYIIIIMLLLYLLCRFVFTDARKDGNPHTTSSTENCRAGSKTEGTGRVCDRAAEIQEEGISSRSLANSVRLFPISIWFAASTRGGTTIHHYLISTPQSEWLYAHTGFLWLQ